MPANITTGSWDTCSSSAGSAVWRARRKYPKLGSGRFTRLALLSVRPSEPRVRATVVYALVDPRDGTVRYVGQTHCPRLRMRYHLEATRESRANDRLHEWMLELIEQKLSPLFAVLGSVPPVGRERYQQHLLDEMERRWIKKLRKTGDLYNLLPGGTPRSQKRKKRSAAPPKPKPPSPIVTASGRTLVPVRSAVFVVRRNPHGR